ncbi:MAG: hypothetical protein DRN12_05395 [Thermoplasmata archaeon]|nr:MAG: hypothetical protein DRN12_05395 [Thermoplasmata archaeon]
MSIDIHHIAIQRNNKNRAIEFFEKLLGYKLVKNSLLPPLLSRGIFDIDEEVEMLTFSNRNINIEVFITDRKINKSFAHICLYVENLEDFLSRCKEMNLKPFSIDKDGRKIFFVRDEGGNLFEIKQR